MPDTGEVLAVTQGGSTEVPIHDLAGSTIGLVGSSNTLATQWSYEPFSAPTASGAASAFQFLFRGQQYDPTGYYGDYNPRLQRSTRGDVLPYTGQGSNEFGHAPGYMPFKFHRTPTPWGRIGIDGA